MSVKKAIVTGANGFIGSKLANYLADIGYEVYAVINNSSNNLTNESIKCIKCRLEEVNDLVDILPKEADALFHLAWVGVSTRYKDDENRQLPNIQYSLDVLKLAKKLKVKKIVYTGSVSEYAYCPKPITGHEEPSPADIYGACKVATHHLCNIYAKKNDLDFNWTLISSVYGPGRDDNNLITYTVESLLKGKSPEYTKLEQRWDYIYIDDLVEALCLIGIRGKKGEVYPIGSGVNESLLYYVEVIREKINQDIPLGVGKIPYKTNVIDNSIVDISKIKSDTGFQPMYSFEKGIDKTIEYFRLRGV